MDLLPDDCGCLSVSSPTPPPLLLAPHSPGYHPVSTILTPSCSWVVLAGITMEANQHAVQSQIYYKSQASAFPGD